MARRFNPDLNDRKQRRAQRDEKIQQVLLFLALFTIAGVLILG